MLGRPSTAVAWARRRRRTDLLGERSPSRAASGWGIGTRTVVGAPWEAFSVAFRMPGPGEAPVTATGVVALALTLTWIELAPTE